MQARINGDAGSRTFPGQLHYSFFLLLIFIAGAAVRLYRIADQVVLDDEWHALNAVQYHDFKWIFTHFGAAGNADLSIPLALLYEFQYQLIGLNEILLRWPMLLAGCAAILVVPHMLRHWLSKPERLMLAALLAISPLLIYYSRFARPYSILAVLESGALLMAWHWWQSHRLKYGVAWVLLAAFSAWLNAPALMVVMSPFAWFGLLAARDAVRARDWTGILRLTALGSALLAVLVVLLGPPLATQPEAILGKAGRHFIDWETLPWALSLASGSARMWIVVSLGMLSLLGFAVLFQRDKDFGRFLLVTSLFALLVLVVSGAAFSVHGNVFLRYIIGLVPFYLSFIAIGLVDATSRIVRRLSLPLVMNAVGLVSAIIVLVIAGPIRDWPLRNNQFVTHQYYHFHYNQDRNRYTQWVDSWYQTEPFYEEIAALHKDGEALIVEAPWYLESYTNPLNLQQEVHRQRVQIGFINGLCAGPLYGELTTAQPGMKFRNFVYLQELLDGTRTADYLVLRRRGMPEKTRVIEMDFDKCEQAVRAQFGEPWRESEFALVFRINPQR